MSLRVEESRLFRSSTFHLVTQAQQISRTSARRDNKHQLTFPLCILAAFIFLSGSAGGQVNPGTPPFSSYDSHGVDTVNLQNLNVSLNIPVMSKPGAIPFSYGLSGNLYVYLDPTTWVPSIQTGLATEDGRAGVGYQHNPPTFCPDGMTSTTMYTNWYVVLGDGTKHYDTSGSFTDTRGCYYTTFTETVSDGSGYTLVAENSGKGTVYTSNGAALTASSITDANGNIISESGGVYTDTLGLTALTVGTGTVKWTDVNGGSPTLTETNSSLHLKSAFGCAGTYDFDLPGQSIPTSLGFPDGTSLSITYEPTPGYSGDYTGRLNQLTLRTGGVITYQYSGSNNGINCTYQVPPTMTRQTSDGTTTYTWAAVDNGSGHWGNTTTVTDNGGNKTVYTFTGLTATGNAASPVTQALTQVQHYQGSSTLLTTDVYCYDGLSGQPGNCATAVVSLPVDEVDVYHTINGMSTSSRTQTKYDNYGNVRYSAQFDFAGTSPISSITTTYGSCSSGCTGTSPTISAIGSFINNKPGDIVTTVNGNTVAESRYTYDSHGNLLTTYKWNGSSWLSNPTANVYNPNGTISTAYNFAGNATTYAYNSGSYSSCGSCTNFPFATSVTKGGLTTYSTWSGIGAVKLTDKDANGNSTTYGYQNSSGTADPFWRVSSVTDPLGNEVWKSYTATSLNSSFSFNSSINNTTVTTDGYGRPINNQIQQSPSATQYDTASAEYGWSSNYNSVTTTLPCATTSGSQCTFTSGQTVSLFDPLGRPYTKTDGGGGTITNTYSQNDVLSMLGPAPSFDGENAKQIQNEYDGLGRIDKSCAIGNGSSTACGQNTGSANGVTTTISYTSGTGYQTVSSSRGVQTRSTTVDGLGRLTQKVTPEGGTWSYVYDSNSSCPSGYRGAPGLLASSKDPNGNLLCYSYDSLNRVTGTNANGTTCRHFYYDNSTGYSGSLPTGVSLSNQYGRLVEAATDNCSSGTLITDEWFNYDKNGHVLIMWESTPNSGGYYKSTATFYGNGAVDTLQLSGRPFTTTYGIDGEGRANALSIGSSTVIPANGATYYPGDLPHVITIGTGTDNDTYTYDGNTDRITGYTFTLGSTTDAGTLSWNAIGTLKSLAIADGFNSGGTQTCNFGSSGTMGYDDLNRLLSDVCGSGGSIWNQTYSYDQYDNLTKSSTGFVSWNPGYDPSNNHYKCTGCTYDSNGNVTNDGTTAYTWNEFSKMGSTNKSGTNCASAGQCVVYDAFGNIVEIDSGSTKTEVWYTQLGKTAYMNGSTYLYSYWPAPGGGTAMHNYPSSGSVYFMHKDWLGTVRLGSNLALTVIDDYAFAPYGEKYDIFGSTSQNETMFTGDTQDVLAGMYDTPNRELQGSQQGRWLSPDPAGAGWNQYAYSTNPNSETDPLGLQAPGVGAPCLQGATTQTGLCSPLGGSTIGCGPVDGGGGCAQMIGGSLDFLLAQPMFTWGCDSEGRRCGFNTADDDAGLLIPNNGNTTCTNYVMLNCGPANNGAQQPQQPQKPPTWWQSFTHPSPQQCRRVNIAANAELVVAAGSGATAFLAPVTAPVTVPAGLGLGLSGALGELWVSIACP